MAINSVSTQQHYFISENLHKSPALFEEMLTVEIPHEVTDSVIEDLEKIENHPVEKYYSENQLVEINGLLTKLAEKIRIVTYNILFDLFDDQLKDQTTSWVSRLPRVVESVNHMRPDVLCLQETYPNQIEDLQKSLGDRYDHFVGAGATGEVNAIFYNKERFEIDFDSSSEGLANATLLMPLNPKDEARVAKVPHLLPPELEPGRQLTLAHFTDRLTGKKFTVINAHLTFYRINSREDQAQFIAGIVEKLHAQKIPVVFTGDLNTFPNQPDRKFPFVDGTRVCQVFQRVMKETKDAALLGHLGPNSTGFQNFITRDGKGPWMLGENPDVVLDHIYVSPEVPVIIHATETAMVDGHFPSDHLPVVADIILPD